MSLRLGDNTIATNGFSVFTQQPSFGSVTITPRTIVRPIAGGFYGYIGSANAIVTPTTVFTDNALWELITEGGERTFLGLDDTPGSYPVNSAGQSVVVNSSGDGLEFSQIDATSIFDEDEFKVSITTTFPNGASGGAVWAEGARALSPSSASDRTFDLRPISRTSGRDIRDLQVQVRVGPAPFTTVSNEASNVIDINNNGISEVYRQPVPANAQGSYLHRFTFNEYETSSGDLIPHLVSGTQTRRSLDFLTIIFPAGIITTSGDLPNANGFSSGVAATNVFAQGSTIRLVESNTPGIVNGIYRLRLAPGNAFANSVPSERRYTLTLTNPTSVTRFIWELDITPSITDSREARFPDGDNIYIQSGCSLITTEGTLVFNPTENVLAYPKGGILSLNDPLGNNFKISPSRTKSGLVFPVGALFDGDIFILETADTLDNVLAPNAHADTTVNLGFGVLDTDTEGGALIPRGSYRYDSTTRDWLKVEVIDTNTGSVVYIVDDNSELVTATSTAVDGDLLYATSIVREVSGNLIQPSRLYLRRNSSWELASEEVGVGLAFPVITNNDDLFVLETNHTLAQVLAGSPVGTTINLGGAPLTVANNGTDIIPGGLYRHDSVAISWIKVEELSGTDSFSVSPDGKTLRRNNADLFKPVIDITDITNDGTNPPNQVVVSTGTGITSTASIIVNDIIARRSAVVPSATHTNQAVNMGDLERGLHANRNAFSQEIADLTAALETEIETQATSDNFELRDITEEDEITGRRVGVGGFKQYALGTNADNPTPVMSHYRRGLPGRENQIVDQYPIMKDRAFAPLSNAGHPIFALAMNNGNVITNPVNANEIIGHSPAHESISNGNDGDQFPNFIGRGTDNQFPARSPIVDGRSGVTAPSITASRLWSDFYEDSDVEESLREFGGYERPLFQFRTPNVGGSGSPAADAQNEASSFGNRNGENLPGTRRGFLFNFSAVFSQGEADEDQFDPTRFHTIWSIPTNNADQGFGLVYIPYNWNGDFGGTNRAYINERGHEEQLSDSNRFFPNGLHGQEGEVALLMIEHGFSNPSSNIQQREAPVVFRLPAFQDENGEFRRLDFNLWTDIGMTFYEDHNSLGDRFLHVRLSAVETNLTGKHLRFDDVNLGITPHRINHRTLNGGSPDIWNRPDGVRFTFGAYSGTDVPAELDSNRSLHFFDGLISNIFFSSVRVNNDGSRRSIDGSDRWSHFLFDDDRETGSYRFVLDRNIEFPIHEVKVSQSTLTDITRTLPVNSMPNQTAGFWTAQVQPSIDINDRHTQEALWTVIAEQGQLVDGNLSIPTVFHDNTAGTVTGPDGRAADYGGTAIPNHSIVSHAPGDGERAVSRVPVTSSGGDVTVLTSVRTGGLSVTDLYDVTFRNSSSEDGLSEDDLINYEFVDGGILIIGDTSYTAVGEATLVGGVIRLEIRGSSAPTVGDSVFLDELRSTMIARSPMQDEGERLMEEFFLIDRFPDRVFSGVSSSDADSTITMTELNDVWDRITQWPDNAIEGGNFRLNPGDVYSLNGITYTYTGTGADIDPDDGSFARHTPGAGGSDIFQPTGDSLVLTSFPGGRNGLLNENARFTGGGSSLASTSNWDTSLTGGITEVYIPQFRPRFTSDLAGISLDALRFHLQVAFPTVADPDTDVDITYDIEPTRVDISKGLIGISKRGQGSGFLNRSNQFLEPVPPLSDEINRSGLATDIELIYNRQVILEPIPTNIEVNLNAADSSDATEGVTAVGVGAIAILLRNAGEDDEEQYNFFNLTGEPVTIGPFAGATEDDRFNTALAYFNARGPENFDPSDSNHDQSWQNVIPEITTQGSVRIGVEDGSSTQTIMNPLFNSSAEDSEILSAGYTFPNSPETGDRFFLINIDGSDERGLYEYNGTDWDLVTGESTPGDERTNIEFGISPSSGDNSGIGAFIPNSVKLSRINGGLPGSGTSDPRDTNATNIDSSLVMRTDNGNVVISAGVINGDEGEVRVNSDLEVGSRANPHRFIASDVSSPAGINTIPAVNRNGLFFGSNQALYSAILLTTTPADLVSGDIEYIDYGSAFDSTQLLYEFENDKFVRLINADSSDTSFVDVMRVLPTVRRVVTLGIGATRNAARDRLTVFYLADGSPVPEVNQECVASDLSSLTSTNKDATTIYTIESVSTNSDEAQDRIQLVLRLPNNAEVPTTLTGPLTFLDLIHTRSAAVKRT